MKALSLPFKDVDHRVSRSAGPSLRAVQIRQGTFHGAATLSSEIDQFLINVKTNVVDYPALHLIPKQLPYSFPDTLVLE